MKKIEKIRQEIAHLKGVKLYTFSDILSEEPVCLYDGEAPNKQKCGDCTVTCSVRVEEEPDKSLEEAAEEYAKGEGLENSLGGWEDMYDAFIAGAKYKEEQMMKDAVEGVVCKNEKDVWIELRPNALPEFKDMQLVKVIVIKEDDK